MQTSKDSTKGMQQKKKHRTMKKKERTKQEIYCGITLSFIGNVDIGGNILSAC